MIKKMTLYFLVLLLCNSCMLWPDFSRKKAIKYNFGDTVIFGKLTIFNEDGKDITSSCATRTWEIEYGKEYNQDVVKNQPIYKHFLKKDGFYLSKSEVGVNALYDIYCVEDHFYNSDISRVISGKALTVNVSNDSGAIYFGDVSIILNEDFTYIAKIVGYENAKMYNADLPILQSELQINYDKQLWKKNYHMKIWTP